MGTVTTRSVIKNIALKGFKTDSFLSISWSLTIMKKKNMNLKRAICFNLFSQARREHGDCRFTSPTAILHAWGFGLPGNFEDCYNCNITGLSFFSKYYQTNFC